MDTPCVLKIILLSCYTTACYSRHFELQKKIKKGRKKGKKVRKEVRKSIIIEISESPQGPQQRLRNLLGYDSKAN